MFDYPTRESVFILSSAWHDPICTKALKNYLTYPWVEKEPYKVYKAPWNKENKVCAILAHPRDNRQKIIMPFDHIDPIHLNAENLSNLMRYKSKCLWCNSAGTFNKKGNEAIVCFDKLHNYYIKLYLMNSKAQELEVNLDIPSVANITYNFNQNIGKATYDIAKTENRAPLIISGIQQFEQIIKTTKKNLSIS